MHYPVCNSLKVVDCRSNLTLQDLCTTKATTTSFTSTTRTPPSQGRSNGVMWCPRIWSAGDSWSRRWSGTNGTTRMAFGRGPLRSWIMEIPSSCTQAIRWTTRSRKLGRIPKTLLIRCSGSGSRSVASHPFFFPCNKVYSIQCAGVFRLLFFITPLYLIDCCLVLWRSKKPWGSILSYGRL